MTIEGMVFTSEVSGELGQVILYQPGGAAKEHPVSVPARAALPAGPTAMDVSPQRALPAAVSHEVADLSAPATVAGEQSLPDRALPCTGLRESWVLPCPSRWCRL